MISGKPAIESDFIGKVFGKLTIIKFLNLRNHHRWVQCLCSCGKEMDIVLSDVVSGHSKSCGCFNRETILKNRQ